MKTLDKRICILEHAVENPNSYVDYVNSFVSVFELKKELKDFGYTRKEINEMIKEKIK